MISSDPTLPGFFILDSFVCCQQRNELLTTEWSTLSQVIRELFPGKTTVVKWREVFNSETNRDQLGLAFPQTRQQLRDLQNSIIATLALAPFSEVEWSHRGQYVVDAEDILKDWAENRI